MSHDERLMYTTKNDKQNDSFCWLRLLAKKFGPSWFGLKFFDMVDLTTSHRKPLFLDPFEGSSPAFPYPLTLRGISNPYLTLKWWAIDEFKP